MARLAALAPRPRANLTRFHGVFAPNSKHRALVAPSKRGKRAKRRINGDGRSPVEQHAAMTWAQRLKRVFNRVLILTIPVFLPPGIPVRPAVRAEGPLEALAQPCFAQFLYDRALTRRGALRLLSRKRVLGVVPLPRGTKSGPVSGKRSPPLAKSGDKRD
jgi:hypothetical protein